MKKVFAVASLIIILTILAAPTTAQSRQRSEISVEDTWKLEDLFPSDAAWRAGRDKLAGRFDQVLKYKGKLTESAATLLDCLKYSSDISKEFGRLFCYAGMKSDEDKRLSKFLAMKQELEQMATDFAAKSSFIEPELAKMDKATIDRFIVEAPGLKIYKFSLYNILRMKKYTL